MTPSTPTVRAVPAMEVREVKIQARVYITVRKLTVSRVIIPVIITRIYNTTIYHERNNYKKKNFFIGHPL
jgi:hypothetical protein